MTQRLRDVKSWLDQIAEEFIAQVVGRPSLSGPSKVSPEVKARVPEKLKKALEDQINMIKGLDRKVTQLQTETKEKEKIISEKDQVKKTVEQQIEELTRQLSERDAIQKAKEKESLVIKVIAESKLDPVYDFDFLHKYETEEMIKEKALERVEYYKKLKEEGFKERASGSVPKVGTSVGKDLTSLSLDELNSLAQEKPDMKAQINEAIIQKIRS